MSAPSLFAAAAYAALAPTDDPQKTQMFTFTRLQVTGNREQEKKRPIRRETELTEKILGSRI